MIPIVDGLESEFAGTVNIVRLNAYLPENATLQKSYGISGHPSFVVLDADNNITQRYFGPQEEDVLWQAMTQISSN